MCDTLGLPRPGPVCKAGDQIWSAVIRRDLAANACSEVAHERPRSEIVNKVTHTLTCTHARRYPFPWQLKMADVRLKFWNPGKLNVIMEQSPVAWPLPFLDSSRDDHERRVAALRLRLRLSQRFGLIRFKWFGLDLVPSWSTRSSDLVPFRSCRSDDGADVGDVLVAVFFFFSSWVFEALGGIFRSWRRNFLWRSTAVGLLCDYDSRLLDRVRWWPPHMVSPEIVSNMKRWTVWWR